jgi:hypothetical protein
MEQHYLDALLVVDKQIARRFSYKVEVKQEDAWEVARTLDGTIVAGLITEVNDVIPGAFFGEGHVSNGDKLHTFEIGLEYGQRVVYVSMVKGYYHDWTRVREAQLFDQFDKIARRFKASESYLIETCESHLLWRFWWGS